ncbi:MAG: T9SS type A sorting domain-containing protein, partial [Chitinophagaceae bacterium]
RNIFWSGNATSASPTWQVIDGALGPVSSQSCAIVLTTNGVEYYVGTSVGLYSTTQINGNNTSWLNEGGGMMKRAIIRDLVNRQRDNTLVVGTHGNGGFIAKIGNAVNLDVATGINDPVTNDSRFITSVYPTVTRGNVNYTIGSMFSIRRISVQLFDHRGQLVYNQSKGYNSGSLPLTNLASGTYILHILSDDGKYRHVQKLIKQ